MYIDDQLSLNILKSRNGLVKSIIVAQIVRRSSTFELFTVIIQYGFARLDGILSIVIY